MRSDFCCVNTSLRNKALNEALKWGSTQAKQPSMFEKIRTRLLIKNLLVFAVVLSGSAIAIRLVFVRNLIQQATDNLVGVGQGIVAEAELENGQLVVEDEFLAQTLFSEQESFEWFDLNGKLVERMGDFFPVAPLDTEVVVHIEDAEKHIHSVVLPIIGEETGEQIGYVRINQLMDGFERTVWLLDIGLFCGVVVGTLLSSAGIWWLNRQAMQPIEESFQRLKQFTADASHELRSPLMAISSNAEVALKYPQGMREDDREAMLAMLSAAEQMKSLTEGLLLLARTDRVLPMQVNAVNLSELLDNLARLYRPQAEEKQIELTANISPNLWLKGDLAYLTRAFTNLLQNAIRYTPAGGTVELRALQSGPQLQVMILDTGVGIAKENLEKIFERFWRTDRARRFDDGGSGLGLSITQAVVQSHGGKIAVTSTLGKGSCFVVTLPTAQTIGRETRKRGKRNLE